MNTPTKITFVRILLTPLMFFFYFADFIPYNLGKLFAFVTLLIACTTDFLDGYIARKYNMVTDMGKFLDPIADKLLATTALLLLIIGSDPVIPTIIGSIYFFMNLQRDYVITGFRQIAQLKGLVIAADKPGKLKAIFLYSSLNVAMFYSYIRVFDFAQGLFGQIYMGVLYALIVLAVLFMIISEINYFVKNPTVLKERAVTVTKEVDNQPIVDNNSSIEKITKDETEKNDMAKISEHSVDDKINKSKTRKSVSNKKTTASKSHNNATTKTTKTSPKKSSITKKTK